MLPETVPTTEKVVGVVAVSVQVWIGGTVEKVQIDPPAPTYEDPG
jgi:hypothetical protein